MSETVHYTGIARPINEVERTPEEIAQPILDARGKTLESYHSSATECLCDEYYMEFFYHTKSKTLYHLENTEVDAYNDIIEARRTNLKHISYNLRYYNGGAGFQECLEEALDNLQDKETPEDNHNYELCYIPTGGLVLHPGDTIEYTTELFNNWVKQIYNEEG